MQREGVDGEVVTGFVISVVVVVSSLVAEGMNVVLSEVVITVDVVIIENDVVSSLGLEVSLLVAAVVIGVDVLKCVVKEHGTKTQHKILIS